MFGFCGLNTTVEAVSADSEALMTLRSRFRGQIETAEHFKQIS
jgi:hypothetical protein